MRLTHARRLPVLPLALCLSRCATLPAGRLEEGAPSAEAPARFFGGHVLLPVRIAEAGPVWLLLDTGADMTIPDLAVARELRVPIVGTSQLEGRV